MKKRIKFVVLSIFFLVGIAFFYSDDRILVKATDPILEEISSYRTWNKVTKEPIKVNFVSVLKVPPNEAPFTIDGASGGG